MKCFYTISLDNKDLLSEMGVKIMNRISKNKPQNLKSISLKDIYEIELDNEDFRQNVLNNIICQISIFNPIRYEGICYVLYKFKQYKSLWKISIILNTIFIMVIDHNTLPLRGKLILDFIVDWSEKFIQSNGELKSSDLLILLHILAPSGQLQLLNDDILSKIELMVNKGIKK